MNFKQWLLQESSGALGGFFDAIVDNPTNMSNYSILADFMEEEGLNGFSEMIRLCIKYGKTQGKESATITRRLNQLHKQHPVLDEIQNLMYSSDVKRKLYTLSMKRSYNNPDRSKPIAYTYDSSRDTRRRSEEQKQALKGHPQPDHPFVTAYYDRFDTSRNIDVFKPEIIAAMILRIMVIHNPEISEALRKSKSLSNLSTFGQRPERI